MATLNFSFNKKLPGSLTGGNFGQSMTPIIGYGFNSVPFQNALAIGNTNSFGAVGSYVQLVQYEGNVAAWTPIINLSTSDETLASTLSANGFSGNVILVSDSTDATNQGAAYIFNLSEGIALQTQKITGGDSVPGDLFVGLSVYGNTLVAAGVGHNANKGAAYIFNFAAGTWTQAQEIAPADLTAGSFFGSPALIVGNQMFISAPFQAASLGAVYCFQFVGGSWVQTQKLVGTVAGAQFGEAIAYDGVSLVIGAPSSGTGFVYVYTQNSAGQFILETSLLGSDSVSGDHFGFAVSVAGFLIAVGAIENDTHGAVYLFENLVQTQKIVQTDATGADRFGCAVQLFSGQTSWLAVGAYGNAGIGAAYFYSAPDPASLIVTTSQLIFQGVRRNPGQDPRRTKYAYKPRQYSYILTNVFETIGIVSGQFAPVQVLTQLFRDYDFELWEFRLAYAGPSGPVPLTVPYSALWVYDVNKKQISNLPVNDVFLNGCELSKYQNGAMEPPLLYPVNSELRIELTNLITNPALLPLTLTLELKGRQRIPC